VRPYFPVGSDERQYNAPGIRLPVGSFMRTPAGEFKGYHTSEDDMSNIDSNSLLDTLEALLETISTLEANVTFRNRYVGEPCLSQHGFIYPVYPEDKNDRSKYFVKILAHEFDGKNTLLDIAEKWNIPISQLGLLVDQFLVQKLIEPVNEG